MKIILAYSGGLDTSVLVHVNILDKLADPIDVPVAACTLGQ